MHTPKLTTRLSVFIIICYHLPRDPPLIFSWPAGGANGGAQASEGGGCGAGQAGGGGAGGGGTRPRNGGGGPDLSGIFGEFDPPQREFTPAR
eukprot:2466351-Pyramimonas_sp.AAC.1